MISIDSQRTKFNIVISDVKRCKKDIKCLTESLSLSGFQYYIILHDKDVNNDGEFKRAHYHCVLSSVKRYRVKQIINLFVDCLSTNEENIQVMECDNFIACVQYLIHKNDLDKYQYNYKDIISNDSINLIPILNELIIIDKVTTQKLFDLIFKDGLSRKEIIFSIGIGAYQHYRNTINDLLEMRK